MNRKAYLTNLGIGAAAFTIACAGGWALANAEGAAVNAPAQADAASPGSFADIVQKVAPAVVSIDVVEKAGPNPVALQGDGGAPGGEDGGAQALPFGFRQMVPQGQNGAEAPPVRASGSGFFISPEGYILTNNHVVQGAVKITVRTKDGRELSAHLVGVDPATDLAVIQVSGGGYPFVSFEDRAKPRVGDWVVAVGNPFGLGGTATAGIVSALARPNMSNSSYVDYMQIDAPINRGNSGGPTFDVYGRVVGVNSAIYSPSGGSVGIGFDIPADVAASVSQQLIAHGDVVRGFIGATVQDLTPPIAESLGVAPRSGALLAQTTEGGPSDRAGLRSGDLILKVDGRPVTSASDMTRQVALAHPGDEIAVQISRDGKVQEVSIRAGQRPSEASLASNDDQPGGQNGATPGAGVLGMQLEANPRGGVTIDGVRPGSDAGEKGLGQGDVILRAGDHGVSTPSDVAAAADQARQAGRKEVLVLVTHDGRNLFVPLRLGQGEG